LRSALAVLALIALCGHFAARRILAHPQGSTASSPAGLPKLANQTWARSDRDNPCSWAIRSRVEGRVSEQSVSRKVRRSGCRRSRSGPGQVAGFASDLGQCARRVGAENRVTSCDVHVLMYVARGAACR
jgi:hypothetical protein